MTDSLGNPVSGVAVTFVASGDGVAVTGASATSDGSGIAAVDSWTLGTTAATGSDTLFAILGTFDTLVIPATANVAAAGILVLDVGGAQSATVGTAVTIDPGHGEAVDDFLALSYEANREPAHVLRVGRGGDAAF